MRRFLEVFPWAVAAGCWGLAAVMWGRLPEVVPVHWDLYGAPDRWGGRAEAALVLPAVLTGTLLLLEAAPRWTKTDLSQMRGAWAAFRSALALALAGIHGAALGLYPVGTAAPALIGALFMVLGAVMGKIRPNPVFGIRTPWTLTSKRAWLQTHRLGGFGFLGVGFAAVIGGLAAPEIGLGIILAGTVALTVGLFLRSWQVWAADPDRQPPAGTTRV